MSDSIESLYLKRRQIRAAWDQERIPSKELIHDLLNRTLNIAPSKQNLFPFKIHIIEPENEQEHKKISGICALWKTGAVNNWNEDVLKDKSQGYKKAPWVLIFTPRLCEPNNFVIDHSKKNNCQPAERFNQVNEERYKEPINTHLSAVEIGMFIEVLTGLCLENDIQCSYIKSFPEWMWDHRERIYLKERNPVGFSWDILPWITEMPVIVMQLGYKANIVDKLATNAKEPNRGSWEDKPSIDTIVEYHSS